MGLFFKVCKGSWWLLSKNDPRWNSNGQSDVGGFAMSEECKQKLEELKHQFGEPPGDLEWGYMKD